MTQAKPRYQSVEEYLSEPSGEFQRTEYFEGELIQMPPESGRNNNIALSLQFHLVLNGFFSRSLVIPHSCEIQVEKFHPEDKETRMPDLVILRPEHIALTQDRLTITLGMPVPLLIAEVVSPYSPSRQRNFQEDYVRKPYQYAMRGIPEYWIIDPQKQAVTVQFLPGDGGYAKAKSFCGEDAVRSQLPALADLQLTAHDVLGPKD